MRDFILLIVVMLMSAVSYATTVGDSSYIKTEKVEFIGFDVGSQNSPSLMIMSATANSPPSAEFTKTVLTNSICCLAINKKNAKISKNRLYKKAGAERICKTGDRVSNSNKSFTEIRIRGSDI